MADPQTPPTSQTLDPQSQAILEKALQNKDQLDPVTQGLLMDKARQYKLGEFAPQSQEQPQPGILDRFLGGINPLPALGEFASGIGSIPGKIMHPSHESDADRNARIQARVNAQVQQAIQAQGGSPGHAALEGIPFVGPLANDVSKGNWRGAIGDTGAFATQIFGPKVVEALNAPTRFVGDKMLYTPAVEKVVGMNSDVQTLGKFQEAVDYFKKNELLPKDIQGNQKLIDQATVAKRAALAQATATPTGRAFIGPLLDTAKTYLQSGDPIPQKILDAMDQFSTSGPKGIDYWQQMKEALDKRIRSKSVLSGQGMGEKSLNTQVLEQRAQGLRQGIPQFAPGLDEANKQIHLGMLTRKAMENYQMRTPNPTENIPPVVAGALAGEMTPGPTGITHAPVTSAGITALMVRMLTKNPQIASKLGLPMMHAGTGPISLSLGQLARLGLLRPNQEPPQDK